MNENNTSPATTSEQSPRLSVPSGYAVIACRWGWSNNGFSVITQTPDLERAKMEADQYSEYRGGKYGTAVYDPKGNQVYYAASIYGEQRHHLNWRMDMFERFGNRVVAALESGKPITIEQIKEKWAEAKAHQELMERFDEKHNVKAQRRGPKKEEL